MDERRSHRLLIRSGLTGAARCEHEREVCPLRRDRGGATPREMRDTSAEAMTWPTTLGSSLVWKRRRMWTVHGCRAGRASCGPNWVPIQGGWRAEAGEVATCRERFRTISRRRAQRGLCGQQPRLRPVSRGALAGHRPQAQSRKTPAAP